MIQASLFSSPRAFFSECTLHRHCLVEACKGRLFRYRLYWPTGEQNERIALGIFANPSTATAEETDPTVRRWIGYARRWGFGWASVANARAWRETNPKLVPGGSFAIGPENDEHISAMAREAELVVCGWGHLGGARGPVVLELVRLAGKVPHALKLNADGSPAHPLYLDGSLKPFPMGDES